MCDHAHIYIQYMCMHVCIYVEERNSHFLFVSWTQFLPKTVQLPCTGNEPEFNYGPMCVLVYNDIKACYYCWWPVLLISSSQFAVSLS